MGWFKKAEASEKEEIIELLEQGLEHLEEAYSVLRSAAQSIDANPELSPGYNIVGNMEGYVLNYISGGASGDSLTDKVATYIEEIRMGREIED